MNSVASRITLALGAALAIGLSGCSTYHAYEKCGFAGCPGDGRIASQVRTALRLHPGLEYWNIQVQALDDVVYLYGIVDTDPERSTAQSVAIAASGGKKVVNAIAVRGNVY